MSSTDPAVPRRCTCPHFENEHEEGGGRCRATVPGDPGAPEGLRYPILCACQAFTARDEPARARARTEPRAGERLPEQIAGRVLAIRDRAAEAGRLVTTAEQEDLDARRRAREQAADRVAAAHRALEQLEGIPTRFRSSGEHVVHPRVNEWTRDVIAGTTTDSLVLLGGVGTGKTSQAFAAFRNVVTATRREGRWTTVPDLLEDLRPGRRDDGGRLLTDLQRTPLLLLDDLAAQRDSEWTAEILYRLLDYRYAWQLPAIITSNVPPAEIRARLGDRIASRLNGMGRTVVLEGPDRRTPGQG